MVRIFKPSGFDFKEIDPFEKFRLETAVPRLSSQVGANHLMFDLRRLNPGHYSFPYHFHRNTEEMFVILSGAASLRGPDGIQGVRAGEVVFFGMGEEGAHQLYNHAEEPCLYLDIRTLREIDITEYPDSGKMNLFPEGEIFVKPTTVGYFQGEEEVEKKWEQS
ncbi:cupin domain-containing protein [Sunxiuqinia sp. sy24]|uniref:cupin domain-containing protein n=1 Tax=Sunxiuqinia sp. sy24 TaxID=3461495 RepID=UPI004045744E